MSGIVKFIPTLILMLLFGNFAHAQGFGINIGATLEELEVVSDDGNGLYTVTVPKPHNEFDFYTVMITPETGVCRVSGYGKTHSNDRFGTSSRRAFDNLRLLLEEIYGTHHFADFLRDGSIWDDQNEWVMSFYQNERVYQAIWDEEEQSNLKSEIKRIYMDMNALNSGDSWVYLRYEYNNHDRCTELLKNSDSDGL